MLQNSINTVSTQNNEGKFGNQKLQCENDVNFKVGIPQEDQHIGTEGVHQEILSNFS